MRLSSLLQSVLAGLGICLIILSIQVGTANAFLVVATSALVHVVLLCHYHWEDLAATMEHAKHGGFTIVRKSPLAEASIATAWKSHRPLHCRKNVIVLEHYAIDQQTGLPNAALLTFDPPCNEIQCLLNLS